jgi:micrococcal nuclease
MRKRMLLYFGGLLLLASLAVNSYHIFIKNNQPFLVKKVFDGDTILIEPDQVIRLASIQAPEPEFCYGLEAKQALEKLVLNKKIAVDESRRGSQGRPIALIYHNKLLINEIMLKNGFARYDSTGTSKDDTLLEASHYARDSQLGVYSSKCTQTEPPDPKCAIKGNIEKHYGDKIYHFLGCSGYNNVIVELDRGEQWFCSEKEAEQAGYKKSQKCYGKLYRPSP